LTAQGREDLLFRTVVVAAAVNVALNVIAVPLFGMIGAAVVTVVTEMLRLVLAQRYAGRLQVRAPSIDRYWKAGVAAVLMVGVLAAGVVTAVVPSIALGAIVYGVALLALGGLGRGADGRLQLTV
jgi:O-antigen/teichoic acid export membrane protein